MRVFHFNGRIARGTTDCGRSSSTALQTRRSGATPSLRFSSVYTYFVIVKNNGCYKVQPDSEFYIRSNVYPDDFSKIMKHGLRRLSKKITIDGKFFIPNKGIFAHISHLSNQTLLKGGLSPMEAQIAVADVLHTLRSMSLDPL
ncbi:hypothetical protein NDU88_003682 [Pleurodeles waltl]|nr:hypothetical protein NDU88_003682 [Pleurodeles waltl]